MVCDHLQWLAHPVELLIGTLRIVAEIDDRERRRFARYPVDTPTDALVPLLADRVELGLIVQHLLRGLSNFVQLCHERGLRDGRVPLVAELARPRALTPCARRATLVGHSTVLAVELTLSGLAVRAAEVLVTSAADVVERLLAVAVVAAAVGAIGAESVLAVGSSEPTGAGALSVRAAAVVALFSVALEWGGTGATATATVASCPRGRVWVHALRRSRHQEEEEDRC